MKEDSVQLSNRIRLLIEYCFASDEHCEAIFMLTQLDEHTRKSTERIQIAAIKCSNGSLEYLASCIDLANSDYRDLLMGAGFGYDIGAHLKWAEEILSK